jgi:hypothetical protein
MRRTILYILAMIIGFVPAFFVVLNAVFTDYNGSFIERAVTFGLVVAAYGILGTVFGLLGPETSWRWGIWISLPAAFLMVVYSIREPESLGLSFLYLALAVASSCLASLFSAGRVRRKRGFR